MKNLIGKLRDLIVVRETNISYLVEEPFSCAAEELEPRFMLSGTNDETGISDAELTSLFDLPQEIGNVLNQTLASVESFSRGFATVDVQDSIAPGSDGSDWGATIQSLEIDNDTWRYYDPDNQVENGRIEESISDHTIANAGGGHLHIDQHASLDRHLTGDVGGGGAGTGPFSGSSEGLPVSGSPETETRQTNIVTDIYWADSTPAASGSTPHIHVDLSHTLIFEDNTSSGDFRSVSVSVEYLVHVSVYWEGTSVISSVDPETGGESTQTINYDVYGSLTAEGSHTFVSTIAQPVNGEYLEQWFVTGAGQIEMDFVSNNYIESTYIEGDLSGGGSGISSTATLQDNIVFQSTDTYVIAANAAELQTTVESAGYDFDYQNFDGIADASSGTTGFTAESTTQRTGSIDRLDYGTVVYDNNSQATTSYESVELTSEDSNYDYQVLRQNGSSYDNLVLESHGFYADRRTEDIGSQVDSQIGYSHAYYDTTGSAYGESEYGELESSSLGVLTLNTFDTTTTGMSDVVATSDTITNVNVNGAGVLTGHLIQNDNILTAVESGTTTGAYDYRSLDFTETVGSIASPPAGTDGSGEEEGGEIPESGAPAEIPDDAEAYFRNFQSDPDSTVPETEGTTDQPATLAGAPPQFDGFDSSYVFTSAANSSIWSNTALGANASHFEITYYSGPSGNGDTARFDSTSNRNHFYTDNYESQSTTDIQQVNGTYDGRSGAVYLQHSSDTNNGAVDGNTFFNSDLTWDISGLAAAGNSGGVPAPAPGSGPGRGRQAPTIYSKSLNFAEVDAVSLASPEQISTTDQADVIATGHSQSGSTTNINNDTTNSKERATSVGWYETGDASNGETTIWVNNHRFNEQSDITAGSSTSSSSRVDVDNDLQMITSASEGNVSTESDGDGRQSNYFYNLRNYDSRELPAGASAGDNNGPQPSDQYSYGFEELEVSTSKDLGTEGASVSTWASSLVESVFETTDPTPDNLNEYGFQQNDLTFEFSGTADSNDDSFTDYEETNPEYDLTYEKEHNSFGSPDIPNFDYTFIALTGEGQKSSYRISSGDGASATDDDGVQSTTDNRIDGIHSETSGSSLFSGDSSYEVHNPETIVRTQAWYGDEGNSLVRTTTILPNDYRIENSETISYEQEFEDYGQVTTFLQNEPGGEGDPGTIAVIGGGSLIAIAATDQGAGIRTLTNNNSSAENVWNKSTVTETYTSDNGGGSRSDTVDSYTSIVQFDNDVETREFDNSGGLIVRREYDRTDIFDASLDTDGDHSYFFSWDGQDNDHYTTSQSGFYTSYSTIHQTKTSNGLVITTYDSDGDITFASGDIAATLVGNGHGVADSFATVTKTKLQYGETITSTRDRDIDKSDHFVTNATLTATASVDSDSNLPKFDTSYSGTNLVYGSFSQVDTIEIVSDVNGVITPEHDHAIDDEYNELIDVTIVSDFEFYDQEYFGSVGFVGHPVNTGFVHLDSDPFLGGGEEGTFAGSDGVGGLGGGAQKSLSDDGDQDKDKQDGDLTVAVVLPVAASHRIWLRQVAKEMADAAGSGFFSSYNESYSVGFYRHEVRRTGGVYIYTVYYDDGINNGEVYSTTINARGRTDLEIQLELRNTKFLLGVSTGAKTVEQSAIVLSTGAIIVGSLVVPGPDELILAGLLTKAGYVLKGKKVVKDLGGGSTRALTKAEETEALELVNEARRRSTPRGRTHDDAVPDGISFEIDDPKVRSFKNGDDIVDYTLDGGELTIDWVEGKNTGSYIRSILNIEGEGVNRISGFTSRKLDDVSDKVLQRSGNILAVQLGDGWKATVEFIQGRRYLVFKR